MENKLVLLNNNDPVTTSEIVAFGIGKSHKSVMELIRRYENDLNEFGTFAFQTRKSGGRPIEFYYLNEQQVTFLITLMRNTPTVVKFKIIIIKQFFKMRKYILDQKTMKVNKEYIETREKSKLGRTQETDTIKEFIEYAKKQGSKSADKYYMIFSKMENSAFFHITRKV
jgi:phage regulator Rha-like protein